MTELPAAKKKVRRRVWGRRLAYFLFGLVFIMTAIYGSLAWSAGEPAQARAIFNQSDTRPLVFAHRGGGRLAPENTLKAFERAHELGVDVLELDVRATLDGELIVMHDAAVERTTDQAGAVSEMTLEQVRRLDAGYRWTSDGGLTFPYRAQGVFVPTLREIFAQFPAMKFNIEPKQATPSIIKSLCGIVREYKMTDKTIVGSFSQSIIDEFRNECPEIATAASPTEASKFLAMYKTGLSANYSPPMQALQIPQTLGGMQVVTKEFVDAAHERNLKVHVWTINETTDMQRLLDAGVDGIMTDYPDRLLTLLERKQAQ